MKSEALQIAKSQERAVLYQELTRALTSPVVELLLGLAIIEMLPFDDGKFEKGSTKVWARSAVKTVAVVQAVAPIVPSIAGATSDIIGSVSKNIPAVAGLLAGK